MIVNSRGKKHGCKVELKAIYSLDETLLCQYRGIPLHGDILVNDSGKDSPPYYCRGGVKKRPRIFIQECTRDLRSF